MSRGAPGAAAAGDPQRALAERDAAVEWAAGNQRDLMRAVARVGRLLERATEMAAEDAPAYGPAAPAYESAAAAEEPAAPTEEPAAPAEEAAAAEDRAASEGAIAPYALDRMTDLFGLSPFETDLLMLCAGVELSAAFARLVARTRGMAGEGHAAPTFGLGLAALPGAHWSALAPDAPLRYWRLVELGAGGLTEASLRIDERVLHALAGVETLDERLSPLVRAEPAPRTAPRPDTAAEAAELVLRLAEQAALQLVSGGSGRRLATLRAGAAAIGAGLLQVGVAAIPDSPVDRLAVARLVAREALLDGHVVAIHAEPAGTTPAGIEDVRLAGFVDALLDAPRRPHVVVLAAEPIPALAGRTGVLALRPESGAQRLAAWRGALGPASAALNGRLEALAATFELSPEALAALPARPTRHAGDASASPERRMRDAAASPERGAGGASASPERLAVELWDAARAAARPRMDGLAERIEPAAGWDDLVLPAEQRRTLREIAVHVRRRHRVHEDWGFADKGPRGLGIAALFAGPSGTGKTMAAEVLARQLSLDLYRIDLASVVSKYIGDTEKNLRRLFEAAEGSGAILLFDEADALFGKRSEIRDSHDRYANVEIGYLLQRMETYRGLAILTTNAREALDQAFLRRLRFIVTFPFPDAALRTEIWRRVFPGRTPTAGLVPERLAQLSVAGGQIRNIALAAAFLAADRDEPVAMSHLAEAARTEYAKQERQPSDAELRGWA